MTHDVIDSILSYDQLGSQEYQSESPFPLPLTAFERYMNADDRSDYPMTFVIEIRLSGPFELSVFQESLQRSVQRHPLFQATIAKVGNQLSWIKSQCDIPVTINHPTQDSRLSKIDLRHQPGLKVHIDSDNETTRVRFLFHHAVTDGIGAMRFIGDLLGVYGVITAKEADSIPELAILDPNVLHLRGQLWSPSADPDRSWKRTLGHLIKFFVCLPKGLISTPITESSTQLSSPFVSRLLDRQMFNRIKKEASVHGVSPNDVYLTCLFAVFREWNQRFKNSVGRESYRVLIPSSLRTPEHDQMPAANVISYVLIHSSAKATYNLTKLAKDLSQQMQAILSTADSRLFARVIEFAGAIPGGINCLVSSPLRICTGVLANVGEVKRQLNCHFPIEKGKCRAGSVVLEGLHGAAPIRKGTAVGISLGAYAGELLINFNCDPKRFSLEEANQFADLFVSQLERFPSLSNRN